MSAGLQSRTVRKVTSPHADQRPSMRLVGVASVVGRGWWIHPFGFNLETIQPLVHSAASSRDNAFSRRTTTAGSCVKSLLRPGLRPRGL